MNTSYYRSNNFISKQRKFSSELKDLQALNLSRSYPRKPHITPLAVLGLDNQQYVLKKYK